MTTLDDRSPTAWGTTIPSAPPPEFPDVEDAKSFYLLSRPVSPTRSTYIARLPRSAPIQHPQTSNALDQLTNALIGELRRLLALPPGWDGEHARPITPQALYATTRILATLLDEESEPPQFFPLPDGGIQLGWYASDQAEIEIDNIGDAYAVTKSTTDEVVEGALDPLARPSDLVSHLRTLIKGISIQLSEDRRLA